ncbi:hypothetical protein Pfo_025650 [Paulownia fortunei]|nr:hypothetical protein Pfo_025650 [Paulownia fortunei]
MQAMGFELASICALCHAREEVASHLFINCLIIKKAWGSFVEIFNITQPETQNVDMLLLPWSNSRNIGSKTHARRFIPLLILWYTWCARNNAKHRGMSTSHQLIMVEVIQHISQAASQKLMGHYFWKNDSLAASFWGLQAYFKPKPTTTGYSVEETTGLMCQTKL